MHNTILLALLLATGPFTPAPGCQVLNESMRSESDDEAHALAACDAARASFAELFDEPVPTVRIVLRDQPHYRLGHIRGDAVVFWPTTEAMTPRTEDPEAAERHVADQWREVLPHEIAHLLVAARFFPDAGATPAGEYGTPLPDWLDEGLAIWAEPAPSRKRRVEQARSLPPEMLDLRRILYSPHPATGRAAAYVARDGTARPAEFELWAFYPQSIAALTFIHEHGGAPAVQELVARLRLDPADPLALAGLPGLPDDIEGVIEAWEEWLGEATEEP